MHHPYNSFFYRFVRGGKLRVGIKSRPDQAIIIELMKLLMKNMEVAVKGNMSMLERRDLNKKEAYFMSSFVVSLSWGEIS